MIIHVVYMYKILIIILLCLFRYQVDYQLGVFISRSSVNVFKINKLWTLPVLQVQRERERWIEFVHKIKYIESQKFTSGNIEICMKICLSWTDNDRDSLLCCFSVCQCCNTHSPSFLTIHSQYLDRICARSVWGTARRSCFC